MKKYTVTFHYTVEIEAEDSEHAEYKAWDDLTNTLMLGDLTTHCFCVSEPEEV